MMFWIQLIGVAAFIFLFISYFMKDKEGILVMQIISYLIFSIHYLMLGGFTGSLMEMVCAASSFLNYKNINNKKIYSIILSIVIILVGIISFNHWYSIIPIITCLITPLCLIYGNSKVIRFSGLIAAFGWGLYSFFVHSYAGVCSDIVLFIFIIISIYLRRKKWKIN